jgi:hypothetical protein
MSSYERGPLPRPQYERLDLPVDQHMMFWRQVVRDFDWTTSRINSHLLYTNGRLSSREGETSND